MPQSFAEMAHLSPFGQFLRSSLQQQKCYVIDGATGSEIKNRNPDIATDESWSGITHLKSDEGGDELVREIHKDYVDRGAKVIITNTYASNRHVLGGEDLGHLTEDANRVAVRLAKQVRDNVKHKVWIAGSMSTHPPRSLQVLKDIRTNKACKHTNVTDSVAWPVPEVEEANYLEQATYLSEEGVDVIFLEMVTSLEHGRRICAAVNKTKLPVVLGLTLRLVSDDAGRAKSVHLRDDPDTITLSEVVAQLRGICENIVGVNVMHCPVDHITAFIVDLKRHWDGPIGAYPNNVFAAKALAASNDANTQVPLAEYLKYADEWISAGVVMIGGCCGVGPTYIEAMTQHFAQKGRIWSDVIQNHVVESHKSTPILARTGSSKL